MAYHGEGFSGWQLQAEGRGRTVQGCLEEAVSRLAGRPVRVHGAGRTDAGVHALAQSAHCDVPDDRLGLPWRKALNATLPTDLAVIEAQAAPPDFHARFSATSKTYAYTLWREPGFILPMRRPFVWNVGRLGPLDTPAMDAAAAILVGRHDFAAFQNAGGDTTETVRAVTDIRRDPGITPHEEVWRFSAEGFLKQMVRNLIGCLVAVGRGKVSPEDVRSLLMTRRRPLAPATAPASGLCLERVEYGPGGRERHERRQRRVFHEPEGGQG